MTDSDTLQPTDEGSEEPRKLNLEVQIDKRGACQRHVTVTVAREDVDRYLDEAFDELRGKAEVPGFRPGRAPRKLVQSRFKEQIAEQVKGSLLMDSMQQVNEEHDLSAISEPDLDVEAVVIPDEGPLTFEFNLEVRPDFDVPEWRGLKLEQPSHEYTDEDVDRNLKRILKRYADLVPVEGAVEAEDLITVNLTFSQDGRELSRLREEVLTVRPTLSFQDASYEGFDQLVVGASAGDRRTFEVVVAEGAEDESMRGQSVQCELEILDVKRFEYPELNDAFLERIGGFANEEELRDAVREELQRQLTFYQQRRLREQITEVLTQGADWDLPPDLLRRQYRRELDRAVLELRAAGLSDDVIRSYENQIRQNSMSTTRRALKEHFILERIAEDEELDVEGQDFEDEIMLIAAQSDESPRRVRARLEKRDQMDALRNQIVERKVIQLIASHAEIEDVAFDPPKHDSQAVEHAVSGGAEDEIPQAKHGGDAEKLPEPIDRS